MLVRLERRQRVNIKLTFQSPTLQPLLTVKEQHKVENTNPFWQATLYYGTTPLHLQKGNTCVKQTSP